jgi:Mrp family chromosome partitioning ATPase/capsular polysaccharide biosynthesis protein
MPLQTGLGRVHKPMSIPPPSSGRRQPASVFTRMRRYWLGSAGTFLCISSAFLVLAFIVPPTYQSTAAVEIDGAGLPDKDALAKEIRTAVLESGRIEDLARHSEPGDDPLSGLERARRSFTIAATSERAFSISYDGRRPESALHGAEVLLDAVLEHFARDAAHQDEKHARADLEKRTRELADFVTRHPDFSSGPPAPRAAGSAQPARASAAPRDDPTLSVLRQERVRLESRLAAAQTEAATSNFKNPYEDEGESDIAVLGRQLAQVRLAIQAHQKAVAQRAESPSVPSPEAAAEAARRASLDTEWKRLVSAVVEAQNAPPPGKDVKPIRTARVIEQPRLPSRPIKPNRPLTTAVGVLLGVLAAGVWAFARVNLMDRVKRRTQAGRAATTSDRPPSTTASFGTPSAAQKVSAAPQAPAQAPAGLLPTELTRTSPQSRRAIGLADTVAVPSADDGTLGQTQASAEPSPLAVAEPDKRSLSPTQMIVEPQGIVTDPPSPDPETRASPTPQGPHHRPGLKDAGTQMGMIDAAFVKAQTGTAPQSLAERVEARRIVDVSGDRRSDPPPARGDRPSSPPRSVTPPGPTSSPPITKRIGTPSDPADGPTPSLPTKPPGASESDRPDTSYRFIDRGWRATSKRGSSRPPTRPSDDAGRPDDGGRSVSPHPTELRAPPTFSRQSPAPEREPAPAAKSRTPSATPHAHADAHATSNYPGATQPGWARPSPPPAQGVGEVWAKVSRPSEPIPDDVVEPRSVPPNWSGLASRNDEPPDGQLSGLADKLTELATAHSFVVGVVSERAELEAKSGIAASLAVMTAESAPRVLLMEANFDWPAVHRQMAVSMPNFSGFSQQMHARTRKGQKKPWIVVRCSPNLDILAEGIVRSPGVLYSQQFAEAVSELRNYYRVIVCDGPIVGGADAKPLDAVTDGLIVVAPSQRALMNSLDNAAKWFGKKQLLAAVPADPR